MATLGKFPLCLPNYRLCTKPESECVTDRAIDKTSYRGSGSYSSLLLLGTLASCLAGVDARAQAIGQFDASDIVGVGVEPGVTVMSRRRDDFDPLGIRVGSFMIRPNVSESAGFDDNVLGTSKKTSSPVFMTSGSVEAKSDWARRSLDFGLTVDDSRYTDVPKQSQTNWSASVAGSYDIGRDTAYLGYTHQNLNQTPRDLDTPALDRTIPYRIDTFRAGYNVTFNRLSLRPELALGIYSFDDGTVAGVPYPQRFRDRVVTTPGIVASYELSPRRKVLVIVRNAIADYRAPEPGATVRDYNDTSILTGIDYDGGGLWRTRLLAGYERRTFTSRDLKTIEAPVAEATVVFNPTGLTTLTGTVSRRIADSADETTTGFTETAVKLSVDHEYLRNVLLRANAGFAYNEYGQNQGHQTLANLGASATWLVNRNARLALSYDLFLRDSPSTSVLGSGSAGSTSQRLGGSFNESRYLLRLSFGL
jgi:hypothetical protein